MRRLILLFIIVIGVGCLWGVLARRATNGLTLRVYFQNASGLQPGAQVRVNGVNAGSVTSVRLDPQRIDHPVEVSLVLAGKTAVTIPGGSRASILTDGVLGPSFIEIETSNGTREALRSNAVLPTVEISKAQAAHAMEVVGNALVNASNKLQEDKKHQDSQATKP